MKRLILALLFASAVCLPAVGFPLTVSTYTVNNIIATVYFHHFDSAIGELSGTVVCTNISAATNDIRLYDNLGDHLRLWNDRGEIQRRSPKTGMSQPLVFNFKIPPNTWITNTFKFRLGHRYELPPGTYTVGLVYPLALLPRDLRPANWPEEWSRETFLLHTTEGVDAIALHRP
jgi:hypothetical protein